MTSLIFVEIGQQHTRKTLLVALKNKAGRNNGRTVRHYVDTNVSTVLVDFKRNKDNAEAVVKTIEYDPTALQTLFCTLH